MFKNISKLYNASFKKCIHIRNMASSVASCVPDVDIDPDGVFKYILIKLTAPTPADKNANKVIVRGYQDCPFHDDINNRVTQELGNLQESGALVKWATKVLGGGRIDHDPLNKIIKVYGYSQGFGKADHRITVDLLKKEYADYEITWSDEGY